MEMGGLGKRVVQYFWHWEGVRAWERGKRED